MTSTITKALAVEEDILHGEGSDQQVREGKVVTVTKVRNIQPINSLDDLLTLNGIKFPKARFYKFGAIDFLYDTVTSTYLPVPVNNTLSDLAFGVDLTSEDNAAALNLAVTFCSTNGVHLTSGDGDFAVLSAIKIPKQKGFRWTRSRGNILNSETATTAFYTVDAYSDRASGVSSDFTEGLILDGGMVKPSPITGSFGIALFYVLNTSRLTNTEIRGGANGLLVSKMFYGFADNVKVKDCDNIGISLLGSASDSGVNANVITGLYATGCKNNFTFEDLPGSFSNLLTIDSGCTFENSRETSVIIKGIRPVKITAYLEGNYTDGAPAGVPVDIAIDDALVIVDASFINVSEVNHSPDAFSCGLVAGGTGRYIDMGSTKKKGVLNKFYPSDMLVDFFTDAPNSDFSNPGTGWARKRDNGAALNRAYLMHDADTMVKTVGTVAAIARNLTSTDFDVARAPVTLVELDFTTAQFKSGWSCTFDATSYEVDSTNATRRGGAVTFKISAFKDDAIFNGYGNLVIERVRNSSTYGEWFVQSDGVSKLYIGFSPLHTDVPYDQDVVFSISNTICRASGDIAGINMNPGVPMPDPSPAPSFDFRELATIQSTNSGANLRSSNSGDFLVANSAGTSTLDVPDGLLLGTTVKLFNKGAGAVDINMLGTDTVVGTTTSAASGCLELTKVDATLWLCVASA